MAQSPVPNEEARLAPNDMFIGADATSRKVTIRYMPPLSISEQRIEVPFAMWKQVAGAIATLESQLELSGHMMFVAPAAPVPIGQKGQG